MAGDDELLAELRGWRQVAGGKPARAILHFECHNGRCAVQRLQVQIQEGRRAEVKIFQNPVKCVRCGEVLVFTQLDAR